MAEKSEKASKVAAGMSVTAAIMAALAAFKKPVSGNGGGNGYVLPEEFVQLVAAIAATADSIDAAISQVLEEIKSLAINVQGFPPNAPGIRSFAVPCVVAGTAYPSPDMAIPEGMSLLIKNHPGNPFGTIIQVASTMADAANINSSFPLALNDVVAYQIQNSNQIYVSANIAGALAVFSAEKLG